MSSTTCDDDTIDESSSAFESSEFSPTHLPNDVLCTSCRGAALLIGLWDLIIHAVALCALIVLFERSGRTDVDMLPMGSADSYHGSSSNLLLDDKNFRSSNILLNRILDKHNSTHPSLDMNARNVYSHIDSVTIRWVRSLSQRKFVICLSHCTAFAFCTPEDKCVAFFVVLSATILILAHIWGVLIVRITGTSSRFDLLLSL